MPGKAETKLNSLLRDNWHGTASFATLQANQTNRQTMCSADSIARQFHFLHACLILIFALAAHNSYASSSQTGFHLTAGVGLTTGGDTIKVNGTCSNGPCDTSIQVGNGFQVNFGLQYRLSSIPVSAVITNGYHFGGRPLYEMLFTSSSTSLDRIPIEGMLYLDTGQYGWGGFRLGLGKRYVSYAQIDSTVPSALIKFSRTPGNIYEIGYQIPHSALVVSLRYVREQYHAYSYTINGVPQPLPGPYSGNHIGIFIQTQDLISSQVRTFRPTTDQ